MLVDILVNAGGDNEPFTTEQISLANVQSITANFAADDVIHWAITAADDTDVDELFLEDCFEFKVEHAATGAPDIETDAVFRCVVMEVV